MPSAALPAEVDVAIVGGGLAGLATAFALRGSGLRVAVLEAGGALGGRARSWTDETTGDVVDTGPHVVHNYYCNMLALLRELGTAQQIGWDDAELTTFAHPPPAYTVRLRRWPAPLHLLPAGLGAPHVGLADKLSNLRLGALAMTMRKADVAALDAVDAATLLRRLGVSPRFVDWFWRTTAMTVLNCPLEEGSAGALLRFVRQMLGHADLRLGFARVGLGELFVPPALAAIRAAGGDVHLETPVAGVEVRDGRVRGLALRDGRRLAASCCVLAVEPQALPALLPEGAGLRDAAALAGLRPSRYLSTYLWFAGKLSDKRSWGRMWSPQNLNYDFYDLSNIRAGWRSRPSLIAANIIDARRADGLDDAAVVAATVRELADCLPAAARMPLLHARVHRIAMGIPCCAPGTEALRPDTRTAIDGLYLAGDFVRTDIPLCMESAVRAAMLAAEAIWQRIGAPRALARELPEPGGLCAPLRRLAPGLGMRRALRAGA